MVHISLVPLKGNAGSRYFPFSGYLGLTKVVVQGIVRLRTNEDDKPIPASSLTIAVRCYEARTKYFVSKFNILVDASHNLWTPQNGQEFEELGEGDYPFRIVLPVNVGGHSTLTLPEYRVFWRLEAVINHIPYVGCGTRQSRTYDLALTRHDIPDPIPSPYLALRDDGYNSIQLPTARIPECLYRLSLPSHPAGPNGTYPVSLSLQVPPRSTIHAVSALIERRIELYETTGIASPELLSGAGTASTTPNISPNSSSTNLAAATSALARNSAVYDISPSSSLTVIGAAIKNADKRLSSSLAVAPKALQLMPAKTMITTLATGEPSSSSFAPSSSIDCRVDLSLPPRPPPSQWPIGETMTTELATMRFYLRVKVTVATPNYGPQEFELPEREVQLTTIGDEERSSALAKIAERRAAAPRKRATAGQTSSGGVSSSSSRRPSSANLLSSSANGSSNTNPSGETHVPPVPITTTKTKNTNTTTATANGNRSSNSEHVQFDRKASNPPSGSVMSNKAATLNSSLRARSSAKAYFGSSSSSAIASSSSSSSSSSSPSSSAQYTAPSVIPRRPKTSSGIPSSGSTAGNTTTMENNNNRKAVRTRKTSYTERPTSMILSGLDYNTLPQQPQQTSHLHASSGDFQHPSPSRSIPPVPVPINPSSSSSSPSAIVTAWEEELDRIESTSKKQSEGLWMRARVNLKRFSPSRSAAVGA